jgi:hypothetical protein
MWQTLIQTKICMIKLRIQMAAKTSTQFRFDEDMYIYLQYSYITVNTVRKYKKALLETSLYWLRLGVGEDSSYWRLKLSQAALLLYIYTYCMYTYHPLPHCRTVHLRRKPFQTVLLRSDAGGNGEIYQALLSGLKSLLPGPADFANIWRNFAFWINVVWSFFSGSCCYCCCYR